MNKELSHIEDLIVIYGTLPTGANRTRIMKLIDTYVAQREQAAELRGRYSEAMSLMRITEEDSFAEKQLAKRLEALQATNIKEEKGTE